jgi:hypothetical protein
MLHRTEERRGRAERRARAVTALGATLALSAAAAAAPLPLGRITAPSAGARLVPGSVVEVAWTLLPTGVEEFELLLFLGEDGASVRLTEQLDPALRRFRWEVPNLPSAHARLAIRFNRGDGEEPGPQSALFEIATPHPDAEPPPVAFREGELWVTATFVPARRDLPPTPPRTGAPAERAWSAPETAVLRSWQEGAGPVGAPGPVGPPDSTSTPKSPARPALSRRPLVVPLRD